MPIAQIIEMPGAGVREFPVHNLYAA